MARYKFQTKNPSVRVGEEYTDYVLTDRNAKTTVDFSSVKINTTFSGIDFEFKKIVLITLWLFLK